MPKLARRIIVRRARRSSFLRAVRAAILFCAPLAPLLIGGCATMGQLDAPPGWCSAPAKKFEPPKEGDDLVQTHGEMVEEWEREKSKRRCLQNYARAVSG